MTEHNIPKVEDYPGILEDLYKYINNYQDEDDYLPSVLMEYCFRKDYSPELLADVVSGDSSFKLALELNCISAGTFRSQKVKDKELLDW